MTRVDQPGIKPPNNTWMTLEKSGINIINRPSVDHEKDTPSSSSPCCLAKHPQDNTTQMGDTGGDLVEHSALGHVSIITGLEAVMRQNTEYVLRGGLLTDDGGKVAERLQWHLIYWLLTAL